LDPKKKKEHYSKITNKYFVLNYYDVYKKINLPSIPNQFWLKDGLSMKDLNPHRSGGLWMKLYKKCE
jgi:hypothetical protein